MAGWTDLLHSSTKLLEHAAPSAQIPPLQRDIGQLEALSKKLKSKTRLLAREGLNAEQLARDLKSFEIKTTYENVFPSEATTGDEYLQQVDFDILFMQFIMLRILLEGIGFRDLQLMFGREMRWSSTMGKVHGSLARAGKVRGQTPKVAKQDKKKKKRGAAPTSACSTIAASSLPLLDSGRREELQDENTPNFIEEVVTLFFRDSARLISNIEQVV